MRFHSILVAACILPEYASAYIKVQIHLLLWQLPGTACQVHAVPCTCMQGMCVHSIAVLGIAKLQGVYISGLAGLHACIWRRGVQIRLRGARTTCAVLPAEASLVG